MDVVSWELVIKEEDCLDFATHGCRQGYCYRKHHEKLDSYLPEDKETPNFEISNIVGEACSRCLQYARPCDKKGRGDIDDPCSECRWFGGSGCQCRLANTSLNDTLWHQMMAARHIDFSLAPAAPKETLEKEAKPWDPKPMSDTNIMPGWKGETKAQLLEKPDSMLRPYVREVPRAYLCPPRDLELDDEHRRSTRQGVKNGPFVEQQAAKPSTQSHSRPSKKPRRNSTTTASTSFATRYHTAMDVDMADADVPAVSTDDEGLEPYADGSDGYVSDEE